jgi:ubiquinone/menaquinone biosynthesis C-methylase UbiE
MSDFQSYRDAISVIARIIENPTTAEKQVCNNIKERIQEGYSYFASTIYDRSFFNWGIWDKQLFDEYNRLNFDFSSICPFQDVHSPLLVYYVIRPLVQQQFFNKRIIEVGCGNGLGLKMASHLLHAEYALGVDLVKQLTHNAYKNFYEKNKINYLQGDSELLPLDSSSVDVVLNIESSHLYPQIELFFAEVARVLKPGGFFCYTDIYFPSKSQKERFDAFLKSRKDLKLIQKRNITKLAQNSIYNRLIRREGEFCNRYISAFGTDPNILFQEALHMAASMGLMFLPWWRRYWVKTELMKSIIKALRHVPEKSRSNKCYFYYLVQKIQ